MKIVDRIIKIRMECQILDNNGKEYKLEQKYISLYVFSLIGLLFAGIIAVIVLALPRLLGIRIELITIIVIIISLIPLLIFYIIPKDKKYSKISQE